MRTAAFGQKQSLGVGLHERSVAVCDRKALTTFRADLFINSTIDVLSIYARSKRHPLTLRSGP